jgi:hypothetical protein
LFCLINSVIGQELAAGFPCNEWQEEREMSLVKSSFIISAILIFVSGCTWMVYGPFVESKAQAKMEKSKTAYEACLAANHDYPSSCDTKKKAYEYDKERWLEIRAGWT